MPLFPGRKSKIFLAILLLNGVFLFVLNAKTAQAYHATSSYNKLFNDTLTSQNWNDLFSDFVNTWLPVSMNGPLGIATSSPASGLEVNGIIRGSSLFSSGNVGFGTNNPNARLEVVPTSGYSILAGNFKIGNVALPTADTDAATKGYVDSFVASATSTFSNLWGGSVVGNIWNLNSGNVGIGITNPGTKLTVAGSILGGSDDSYFGMDTTAPRLGYTKKSGYAPKLTHGSSTNFVIARSSGNDILATNTFTDEFVINTSGNVGIGTTAPGASLDVPGQVRLGKTGSGGGITLARPFDGTYQGYVGYTGATNDFIISNAGGGSTIQFRTGSNTERMRIDSAGNVGIGTTTPNAKLEIIPTTGYSILAGNYKIGNVALPTVDSDAATKGYVDSIVVSYVASTTAGIKGTAYYVGITPTAYTGNNNGTAGYVTAESACAAAFASSSVCTPDNILSSIAAGITLPSQDVWIFAGPPGYTAAANDCEGRSVATTAAYGTYWQIAMTGRPQGRGLLMGCNNSLRLACCR